MSVYRTRRRRRTVERRTPKIVILAGIFLLAVFTNVCFPTFSRVLGDKVNSVVNYRGALAVIGEGLSGERPFTEALGDAWTTAFTGSRSAQETDATEPDDVPAMYVPVPSEPDTEPTPDDSGDPAPEGASAFADAAIAAFMQSQDAWSDYALPAGTSYDMPALGINGVAPAGGDISSRFGYRVHPGDGEVRFHYGVDIAAEAGTRVVAFADGSVTAVGESATYGNYLTISHDNNVETMYAHCAEINVTQGQAVTRGQTVALMGETGNATDVCLHFELRMDGVYLNPEYYFVWQA